METLLSDKRKTICKYLWYSCFYLLIIGTSKSEVDPEQPFIDVYTTFYIILAGGYGSMCEAETSQSKFPAQTQ